IIFWAFCAGVIVGGFIALGMMIVRGQYRQNLVNTKEIVGDLFTSASLGEVAEKANRRRSRWHRLPYGIPLCIGFVGYLLVYLQAKPKRPQKAGRGAMNRNPLGIGPCGRFCYLPSLARGTGQPGPDRPPPPKERLKSRCDSQSLRLHQITGSLAQPASTD